ncbi:hypothetical protein [Pedobacter sp. KLB.chiD]|uniref:hypothetical protein n=1 Tax=Pedobacter sp. KLB.chiD TaxID=3387402 RepID=UPI00399B1D50
MSVFWKAKPEAAFNVRRAFRYSPDEKSGAATLIPFSYAGWGLLFGVLWSLVAPPFVPKPDKTESPERSEDLRG